MAQSPFPGMDPYLESPDLWPDVHNRLMNLFAEQLGDLLAPKYVAELNTQIVIDSFGDNPPEIESVLPAKRSGAETRADVMPPVPLPVKIPPSVVDHVPP